MSKKALLLSVAVVLQAEVVDNNLTTTKENSLPTKPFSKAIAVSDIRTQLKEARELTISKKINEALEIMQKLYENNPNNIDVNRDYARYLFWNGDVSQAYKHIQLTGDSSSKLYKQIYNAYHLNKLKQIKSSTKKIKYIKNLDIFAQNNYDVMWTLMKAYIKKYQFSNALKIAQKIAKLYPKSIEAHESVARLLYWKKRYYESLSYYTKMEKIFHKSYAKEKRKVRLAIRDRNKVKKLKSKPKPLYSVAKTDTFKENDDLRYRVTNLLINKKQEHMIGIGYDYFKFSDKRYTDNTKYIEATFPIRSFVLYNKIEDTHRYGLHDTQYYAELYPTMPKPWWGYLTFTFTPDADFYAKYSIGWFQYYDVSNWEFSLGYKYAKYSDSSTNTIVGSYTYYFTDLLYFTQKLYYVTDNDSWSVSNRVDYKISNKQRYYFGYIKSDSYEDDDYISNILRKGIKSDKFILGVELPIKEYHSVGFDTSYEKLNAPNNDYNRKELNLYYRYHW
jgi:YaiO family outer membrane protein